MEEVTGDGRGDLRSVETRKTGEKGAGKPPAAQPPGTDSRISPEILKNRTTTDYGLTQNSHRTIIQLWDRHSILWARHPINERQ